MGLLNLTPFKMPEQSKKQGSQVDPKGWMKLLGQLTAKTSAPTSAPSLGPIGDRETYLA